MAGSSPSKIAHVDQKTSFCACVNSSTPLMRMWPTFDSWFDHVACLPSSLPLDTWCQLCSFVSATVTFSFTHHPHLDTGRYCCAWGTSWNRTRTFGIPCSALSSLAQRRCVLLDRDWWVGGSWRACVHGWGVEQHYSSPQPDHGSCSMHWVQVKTFFFLSHLFCWTWHGMSQSDVNFLF